MHMHLHYHPPPYHHHHHHLTPTIGSQRMENTATTSKSSPQPHHVCDECQTQLWFNVRIQNQTIQVTKPFKQQMDMPGNQPINMSINMSCPSASTTPHAHHDELLPAQSVEQPRVYTSPCWPMSPTAWKHRWPRSGYQTRASTWCVNIMHAKHIHLQSNASTLCMKQYILCM